MHTILVDTGTYSIYKSVIPHVSKCLLQVEDDLREGVAGAVPIPPGDAGKEEVIAALVANVEAMIKADRKITALKQLQVSNIWFRKICLVWNWLCTS